MALGTTTAKKALSINLNDKIYGTFAEIGAGQEVARHFFQAGLASQTVAKSMSAYDMTVSDSIYGKSSRYVSEDRLRQMLNYEHDLLEERLAQNEGCQSTFFAFADTVATSSKGDRIPNGWMGVRFNHQVGSGISDVILHVKIKTKNRLQQQEVLGVLGVNLLYACFFHSQDVDLFLESLVDNIKSSYVEIDIVRMEGEAFSGVNNQVVAVKLVQKGLSLGALIDPDGNVMQVTDCFFNKPILVQRGVFRPVTNTNIEIITRGLDQLKKENEQGASDPFPLVEMSLVHEDRQGDDLVQDLLCRSHTIGQVGYYCLISNFSLFYQVKDYLRESTDRKVAMVIGASHLEEVFSEDNYTKVKGGVFTALGNLFDGNSQIMVFPYKDSDICMTSQSFNPNLELVHLYRHVTKNNFIVDIAGCEELDTSVLSSQVREWLKEGKLDKWQPHVPKKVADLIKEKNYFSS